MSLHAFPFTRAATLQTYTLSLHDALPISRRWLRLSRPPGRTRRADGLGLHLRQRLGTRRRRVAPLRLPDDGPERRADVEVRSEEHTSELQSHSDIVCRLLLE